MALNEYDTQHGTLQSYHVIGHTGYSKSSGASRALTIVSVHVSPSSSASASSFTSYRAVVEDLNLAAGGSRDTEAGTADQCSCVAAASCTAV